MFIRCLILCALAISLALPQNAQAQGELSQCRSYGKEREYPCRVPGNIIRSAPDHLRFIRFQNSRFGKGGIRSQDRWDLREKVRRNRLTRDAENLMLDR